MMLLVIICWVLFLCFKELSVLWLSEKRPVIVQLNKRVIYWKLLDAPIVCLESVFMGICDNRAKHRIPGKGSFFRNPPMRNFK